MHKTYYGSVYIVRNIQLNSFPNCLNITASIFIKYCFCFLLLFNYSTLYAQSGEGDFNKIQPKPPGFQITQFTTDDGLSNSYVLSVIKGQRGWIWAATKDGLNRFDGERFYTYRHDPKVSRPSLRYAVPAGLGYDAIHPSPAGTAYLSEGCESLDG